MRRSLGPAADIEDGGCKSYRPASGEFTGLFALRSGEAVHVYRNACPHLGVPLDWAPNRFLSSDGSHIVCGMHGAQFDIETGLCLAGPCKGERLEKIDCTIEAGEVTIQVRLP